MSNTRRPPSVAARLEFFVRDSDGLPVPSLVYTDVDSAAYQTSDYGVRDSSVPVILSSNAANTAAISAGQFVTISSAKGHYAIDCPSGSTPSNRSFTQAVVVMVDGTQVVDVVLHDIDNSNTTTYAAVQTQLDDIEAAAEATAAALTTLNSALSTLVIDAY